jgi:hypothetical protein
MAGRPSRPNHPQGLFQTERKRSPNPTLVQSEKYTRSKVFQKHVQYEF